MPVTVNTALGGLLATGAAASINNTPIGNITPSTVVATTLSATSLLLAGAGSTSTTALYKLSVVLTPAAVAANITAEQIFALAGVATTDVINVSKPTAQAGLGIVGYRVTSAGNIGITFANVTLASITPTAAETYLVSGIR